MIIFLNASRVPEASSRFTRSIVRSGPPTSLQFLILPEKIAWSCSLDSPVTGFLGLTITAMPS